MNDALKTYLTGIGWFLLSLVSSSANDVMSKYLGTRLHSFEVAFFRFFFSSIVLLPFVVYYGKNTLKTSRPFVHILRGLLLFFGMTSWTYGLIIAPVTTATVVSFSIPLFTLILAVFFLNENIIWPRWVVTVVGFIGLVVTLKPHVEDFNPEILYFVLAAISFAMLDIINKKFVIKESMISMLFYSAIVTAIVSLPVALQYWLTPSSFELALLFVLGSSGSLILFFLLKAFSMVDATATTPYRYLELVISAIAAYFIFNELPDKSTLHGAVIIIPTTLFIIYSEKKAMNRKHESQ
ncbi:DMT family transporter [Rickettsia montanensis]|uniref:S-adenosylmethionine uptake transporter n=1 Tax=Rickettsia montanensis (strain OSU 85-930) TaxID=1105114 RepID=H8KBI3_RICMS|nr:DMT family transporter [Rickettsia montanensis]AFC73774.1 S-adenosylmethionine transporter [Rickettsia montanensis str. OSU 85-930]